MATIAAHAAKDKGNAAFKAGDYADAVGAYTTAIFADRANPIYPLNRAAAYLKLGKPVDAERDCTTTLQLQPKNTKALFRRAQARIELHKLTDAELDLEEALRLEPANDSVKTEIKKLDTLKQKQSKRNGLSAATVASSIGTSSSPSPVKRRRVPIKIVEPPSTPSVDVPNSDGPDKTQSSTSEASTTDLLRPVSSRSLKGVSSRSPDASTPHQRLAPPPSPAYSANIANGEAAQARHKPTSARSGGGIFRAKGPNTIFPTRTGETLRRGAPSQSAPAIVRPASMTLLEFNRFWGLLKTSEERWQLISQVPPENLPALFRSSLEADILTSILATFRDAIHSDEGRKSRVLDYLMCFPQTARFETVTLFLSADEKEVAKSVWDVVGEDPKVHGWKI